jgi:L,D-transpeptidase catalytic domain
VNRVRPRPRVLALAVCTAGLVLAVLALRAAGGREELRAGEPAARQSGETPTRHGEEALGRQGGDRDAVAAPRPEGTAEPARAPRMEAAPAASARWTGRGFAIAVVRPGRSIRLHRRPGGSPFARARARTEFGSPRTLAVQSRRGAWLGVAAPERPNGRLAWVDGRSPALVAARTRFSLHADLSRRTLDLKLAGRRVKRLTVAIGRAGNPTPTGRFAVTDKIDARPYGGTYGCCILALTGHQPVLPPGWPGGDRLAVHGTTATGRIGTAASTGCLRARDTELRPMMRRLPLGTPVFIRA